MKAMQTLREEHEDIRAMLSVFDRLRSFLALGRHIDVDDLAQMLDFFDIFVEKSHHAKEEEVLFPLLEAAGFLHEGGPLEVIYYDHAEARVHLQHMREAVARLRSGHGARRAFTHHARAYVRALRDHIHKENTVLFPLAAQVLTPEADADVQAGFARVDAAALGPGVHDRYHQLVGVLQQRYLREAA